MPRVIEVNALTGETRMREASNEEIMQHAKDRQNAMFQEYVSDLPLFGEFGIRESDLRVAFDLAMNTWTSFKNALESIERLLPGEGEYRKYLHLFASVVAMKEAQTQTTAELAAMSTFFANQAAEVMEHLSPEARAMAEAPAEVDPIFAEMLEQGRQGRPN